MYPHNSSSSSSNSMLVLASRAAAGRPAAARGGVRGLASTPSPDSSDPPRGVWDRLREYLLFRPDAPGYANMPRKPEDARGGFRSPAPASQPPANVPTSEASTDPYNTQYYTRDTRRNQEPTQVFLGGVLSAIPEGKLEQVPAIPQGSPGRPNPAVARYDPTGTRSAMTTTHKAVQAELAKRRPNHLPRPWFLRGEDHKKLVEDEIKFFQERNIPVPMGVGRSLGIPRDRNTW